MKTSPFVVAAVLFVSGIGVCWAKIGDTEAQCVARYGAESDIQNDVGYRQVGDKAVSFKVKTAGGDLDIRIIFLQGLACHETFSNADYARGLSEAQMKFILDTETAGLEWRKGKTVYRTDRSDETYKAESWVRSDGATAIFAMSGKAATAILSGQLEISTKQYTDAQHFYDKENGD